MVVVVVVACSLEVGLFDHGGREREREREREITMAGFGKCGFGLIVDPWVWSLVF